MVKSENKRENQVEARQISNMGRSKYIEYINLN